MNKYLKGFSFGVLSGALLGSVFALLYAPDKGSTTRDRLSYRLSHYMEDLSRLIEQLRKEKEGIVSDAKVKGDKVVDENTDTTDDETADDSEAELESSDEGQPDYKPTGKWEKNGYGGGMFEIVNPKGFVVDTIRGEEKADARIEKENK